MARAALAPVPTHKTCYRWEIGGYESGTVRLFNHAVGGQVNDSWLLVSLLQIKITLAVSATLVIIHRKAVFSPNSSTYQQYLVNTLRRLSNNDVVEYRKTYNNIEILS